MKIAVFIDAAGETAALFQPGRVRVYDSLPDGWRPERDIPFSLDAGMGLAEIRARTLTMLEALAGCRHFVARAIHGALLSYFDGMGIAMWRHAGDPLAVLPHIRRQVEQNASREGYSSPAGEVIRPADAPGEYRLNLIDALQSDSALTSKQILRPFLRRGEFTRLDVLCDHVPKWFPRELPALGVTLTTERLPDGRCRAALIRSASDQTAPEAASCETVQLRSGIVE
ncbi:Fe-only nitrogenase accessory protein AnfO [Martelella alba]|uniref:Fe-only nitrogenase accessory protein AnfO n=1 Tax=Martelella alba TaxID=2590451 RepID=A0ABY2SNX4_9HYPH|nr:Fe-only nitrogenase accessory protein AnfO [Martelella alba]TKI07234.1 Fe-only nitrogenase accessory protein AnfO [Martelella alba]